MQQVLSLVLAAALLAAGLYLLYQELVAPAVTVHMVLLGGLLTTGGAAWFWTEFQRS